MDPGRPDRAGRRERRRQRAIEHLVEQPHGLRPGAGGVQREDRVQAQVRGSGQRDAEPGRRGQPVHRRGQTLLGAPGLPEQVGEVGVAAHHAVDIAELPGDRQPVAHERDAVVGVVGQRAQHGEHDPFHLSLAELPGHRERLPAVP
jgi:hypothetical protein